MAEQRKPPTIPTIKIGNSGSLFNIALNAARTLSTGMHVGGQPQSLVSIIFSVIALEALINEVQDVALDHASEPQPLFLELMEEAERSRVSLESKFVLAHWTMTGKSPDRGRQPFQNFKLLVSLRNQIVHFQATEAMDARLKPEELHDKFINKYRFLNILASPTIYSTWLYLVETKAVAGWACRTASDVALDFYRNMPPGMWKVFSGSCFASFGNTGEIPNRVDYWPIVDADPYVNPPV
jgi:hypothetical protein